MEISDIKVGVQFKFCYDGSIGMISSRDLNGNWTIHWSDGIKCEYTSSCIIANIKTGSWVEYFKTKDQLLAQIAELQKQVEEIKKKENEKYFDLSSDKKCESFVSLYLGALVDSGKFKHKGLILMSDFNWEVVNNSDGSPVLVPTKKTITWKLIRNYQRNLKLNGSLL